MNDVIESAFGNRPGFRAGSVAVVGKPNVGKSTLVNALVGHKVSIVSDKPQTTRKRVLGVATTDDWQIVFLDTPGLHKAHHRLGAAINEAARQSVHGVDAVLVVVDVSRMPSDEDKEVARMLRQGGFLDAELKPGTPPLILCMNKMDKLKPIDVERNYKAYTTLFPAAASIMTCLTRGQNMDILTGLLVERLPEQGPIWAEDEYTDQPVRELAAEIVREKALKATREEVPHALATYVDGWEEEARLTRISVVLLVERDGQKAILIGKGGEMLKKIGSEARPEIEDLVGGKVFLELFVRVRDDWRGHPATLKELGFL